jgi:hypothetical protein
VTIARQLEKRGLIKSKRIPLNAWVESKS